MLAPGVYTFDTSHQYLNQPAGVQSGSFPIDATVTNEEFKEGSTATSVVVNNVAPQFTAADLTLSEPVATEGDTITLSGQFTDPGTLDPHTVTINWGDGSQPTELYSVLDQVVASTTMPGLYSYSTTHRYLNNPPGEPTGGSYPIAVSVADDVSTTTVDTSIVVNNAPPTIRIESTGDVGSSTISLVGVVTDPGILDTETVAWTLTQNGNVIGTATGPDFSFTTPNPVGVLVATATATDNDGGVGTDSAQIVLILQGNATATITTSAITIMQGGGTVGTTSTAGANQIIAEVYGSNDLVEREQLAGDDRRRARRLRVERDAFGRGGRRPARCQYRRQQPGRRRRRRHDGVEPGRRHAGRRGRQRLVPDQSRPRSARDRRHRAQHA